jgi:polar amino acid transport system substrate-binding protein
MQSAVYAQAAAPPAVPATQQQVLKVGYLGYNPPTQLLDLMTHVPSGAAIELITAVAKDAGFTVEFHVLNVGDIIPALNANIIDISAGSQFTQAFKDQGMQFSNPIWNATEALVVSKNDSKDYKTLDDLKGEVIGVNLGGPYEDPLRKSGLYKEVRTFAGGAGAIHDAVAKGEIKAAFVNALQEADNVKNGTYPATRIAASYKPMFLNAAGFMAGKNGADLLKKVNASIAKVKGDGTTQKIFAKYGVEAALIK